MATGTIKRTPKIIDNYTDTSTTDALSANIGKVLFDKMGSKLQVKFQTNGLFSGLIQTGQMWLIFAQRITVTASVGLLIHNYNSTLNAKEIWKDSSISTDFNNQGTVSIKHNGSNDNIYACAIRLY